MSTRRGGKKKAPAQQKQQTISSSSPFEAPEDDVPRPAVPQTTPASPAVVMQQLASKAITPVVTAAKAISTAVRAMPAIAEGPTISTAQLDNDQPSSPGPSAGIQQPAFAMTAQKLFADSHAQQDLGNISKATAAAQESPPEQQLPAAASTDDPDADVQRPAAVSASLQLRSKLQLLCSSCGGWKGTLLLCAILLVPVLVAVMVQGHVLKSQAHALQAQQQLVAAQAQALQDLRTELQATSAQLPNLLQTAHATNSSLSTISAEQTALLKSLESLSALTQRIQQELGSMNGSQQAGEHAWELLKGVAALNCSGQPHESACIDQSAASVESASAALKSILQQSMQAAAQQKDLQDREQLAQQQLLQRQQELMQALPKTIQQVVQQQMSAQAPLPDVALADCGGLIVFTTPVAASILPKLGSSASQHSQHSSSTASTWAGMTSVLQQLQASLRPKQHATDPASTSPEIVRSTAGPTSGSSMAGVDLHQEQLLLHRVLLRPASGLLPVSCIPFVLAPGSPAVVEIQLPQHAQIHSVALHVSQAPDETSTAETSSQPVLVPGQVSVALLNSSSCGGQAVTCTHILLAAKDPAEHAASDISTAASGAQLSGAQSSSPAPASLIQQPSDVLKAGTTAAMYTHVLVEGRTVVSVSAGGSKTVKGALQADGHSASAVLADRVVVIVTGTDGALDVCMGRISVYGRPVDPAGFC